MKRKAQQHPKITYDFYKKQYIFHMWDDYSSTSIVSIHVISQPGNICSTQEKS